MEHQFVPVLPVPYDELIHPQTKLARMRVRNSYVWTMLDYINEGRLNVSMQDIWRRCCYQNNWQGGQSLREVWQRSQGVPVDFMWEWPLSLFLHHWLGCVLDRRYRLSSSDPQYRKWIILPHEQRVQQMKVIPINRPLVNRLDFKWRCNIQGLSSTWVERTYPELILNLALDADAYYDQGKLDWLRTLKRRGIQT